MKNVTLLLIAFALFAGSALQGQESFPFSPDDIDIPYQKFVLDNGLTLIVHEDHKAPIVAVNVWYHVGSKNEKPGKSGFAHLFEHLMFNGSEHFNDDYFQALESIGGTDLNGTTNNDRTNYFQNVPVGALDRVLFLESDRMGHLLGAIDQAKLDEQRGVVQNEKRQGENQPYGRQYDLITKAMFPKGHPYSWTVIGEMEDLNAASLEDVQEWFKTYYGPANTVLSVAGDIDAEEVRAKVIKYFGHIPSGPTLVRQEKDIPIRSSDTRQVYQDRVSEARVTMSWNTPEWGSAEEVYLDLAARVLSSGKNSRLYKRLIYEDQIASSAYAFSWTKEIVSNFIVEANVKPDKTVEEVERAINEELDRFLAEGPSEKELQRVKAQYFAGFTKGIERIGGFGGKSDILAQHEVYGGSPDDYKKTLETVAAATPEDIRRTCTEWLKKGRHTLVCTPFPEYSVTDSDVDRTQGLPELGEPVASKFPDIQQHTLPNGMKIVLARRSAVPTVVMRMMFNAGDAADQFHQPGLSSLALDLMDEGTNSMDALEINEQLQLLGASLGTFSDLDASYVNLNTLKPTLSASFDLMADVILNPSFPEKEFDRLRDERLAEIKREKSEPFSMALRIMPRYLYGENHAYSIPLTGTGTEASVEAMKRDDAVAFYRKWIHPNNATLMVVGDIEMDALVKMAEERFGAWKKGDIPEKNISPVSLSNKGKLFLMDRPESEQSVIFSGYLVKPYGQMDEIAREMAVTILGGEFTSRINMNLREDKHWSYGAGAVVLDAKGQRPFIAYAPVQTDKTKESIQEIIKEYEWFSGEKPVTDKEFEKSTTNAILQLPGQWETNNSVMYALSNQKKYGLPDDYNQRYDDKMRNLKVDQVRQLSKELVRVEDMVFFVVGDQEKILPGLQELDLEIVFVDKDGNPLEKQPVRP